MVAQSQFFVFHTQIEQEFVAVIFPVFKPLQIRAGLAEKFEFHLFEFAYAEDKVSGRDFVSERFAYLTYSERNFSSRRALNVGKVHENALRRFGAEIRGGRGIFRNADKGLEHKVELFNIGKFFRAAFGAFYTLVFNELRHLLESPAGGIIVRSVFKCVIFYEFIRSVAGFAMFAVHKRVGKAAYVSRSHPGFGVHYDSGIEPHVVAVFLHEAFPPGFFDVVFEFHAERTVVPRVGESAVNLAPGE